MTETEAIFSFRLYLVVAGGGEILSRTRPWVDCFRSRFFGFGLLVAITVLLVAFPSVSTSTAGVPSTSYSFVVRVIGPDANGNMVPLTKAVVGITGGHQVGHVNANGEVAVTTAVPAGEYATVWAIVDGYRTTRLQYLISSNSATRALPSSPSGHFIKSLVSLCGLIENKTPVVTLTLVPGDEPAGELVPLKVEVRSENDTPVAGANVTILASDGQEVTSSPTGNSGLTGSMDLERSSVETGLRAFVTAPDGRRVTTAISTSVLDGPGQRYFLVILGNDPGVRSTQGVAVAACTAPAETETSPTATVTTPAAPVQPTTLTLVVGGTTITKDLVTGSVTLSGGITVNGYPSVGGKHVVGQELSATASVNAPLPKGWQLVIYVPPGNTVSCATEKAQTCTGTLTFPTGQSASTGFTAQINNPTGYWNVNLMAWADPGP